MGLVRKQSKILKTNTQWKAEQSDKNSPKELKNKKKNVAGIKKLNRLQMFLN